MNDTLVTHKHHIIPRHVGGICYTSVSKAIEAVGVSRPTLLKRIKSSEWDYCYG